MDNTARQIISILVNNQPGVLSRIAGLFSRRGYNIDGLTVCATEDDSWSRMTITVNATPATVKQIVAQLEKQEDVVKVMDFDPVKVATRELLLIKVSAGGAKRSEIAGTRWTTSCASSASTASWRWRARAARLSSAARAASQRAKRRKTDKNRTKPALSDKIRQ